MKEQDLVAMFETNLKRKLDEGKTLTKEEISYLERQKPPQAPQEENAVDRVLEVMDVRKPAGSRFSHAERVTIAKEILVYGRSHAQIMEKFGVAERTLIDWKREKWWQVIAHEFNRATAEEALEAARRAMVQEVTAHSDRQIAQSLAMVELQMACVREQLETGLINDYDHKMGHFQRPIKPSEHAMLAQTLERLTKVSRQNSGQEHREALDLKGRGSDGLSVVAGDVGILNYDLDAEIETPKPCDNVSQDDKTQ